MAPLGALAAFYPLLQAFEVIVEHGRGRGVWRVHSIGCENLHPCQRWRRKHPTKEETEK